MMRHDYFESIDTSDKAYWLGFIFADGNVSINPTGSPIITVTQKDADHPALFLSSIGSTNKVGKATRAHRAQVRSQKMFNDLLDKGCHPNKSLTLSEPSGIPSHLIRHFIRGYNDGDGGIYAATAHNRPRLRMRGTIKFLNWVEEQLPSGSLVYDKGPTAQLFIVKKDVLLDSLKYLYDDGGIAMERKRAVAMKILGH